MGPRSWHRILIVSATVGLTALPLFWAFARPGDGVPFQDLLQKIDALGKRVAALEGERAQHVERIAALEDLLVHFRRDGNDVTISGANLRVDNGTGRTDSRNGLGNVIVGYNESRAGSLACLAHPDRCDDDRSGSHMFVAGSYHNYSSWGGIVVGSLNATHGAYAAVTGGRDNEASGDHATVGGGSSNVASGFDAAVCGGSGNVATGASASVGGGAFNAASGAEASVCGGLLNDASGTDAVVCGGAHNEASGDLSSITGGVFNEAHGEGSSIGGGTQRLLTTPHTWQAGDLIQSDGPP